MCPASAARPTSTPAVSDGTRGTDSVPQRLVQAAAQLFAEKGFENTSVQEIVDAVGMTKGAMYHYFASKDDLLYEIYARLLRMQTAHLESITQRDGSVEDRLRALVVDLVRTTLANIYDLTIVVRSLHLLSDERRAEIRAARRNYATRFRDLIEEGQRLGTLRSDGMPVELRTYHFFGALHWMHMWYQPDGRYSAEEIARYYADDLLDSLLR